LPASSVLLLANDPPFVQSIRSGLGAAGYQVTATADADEPFRKAGQHALIIIDQVAGSVSPQDVCRNVRATPALAGVAVLCIAQSDDVEERVRFLQAGADEVIAKPFDRRELEARVEALLLRFQHAHDLAPVVLPGGPLPAQRKVIVFFSPKGGMGTTTLTVNVAVALAQQRPDHVALFDLDLQWGQVAIHLNLRPKLTVADLCHDSQALDDPELMRPYAERHGSGLAVYCAPSRPDQAELVEPQQVTKAITGARGLYDTVVVDGGGILDERTLALLEEADDIVLPLYPEIGAIKALLSFLEVLADVGGLGQKTTFVVNHVFPRELVKLRDLENTLGARVAFEVPNDQIVFVKAVNEGVPVVVGAPRTAPAEAFGRLAQLLVGPAAPPASADDAARRSGLGSLLRRA